MKQFPWFNQLYFERQQLAESLCETPIEVKFARELANSSDFGVSAVLPDEREICGLRKCLIPQLPVETYRVDIAVLFRNTNEDLVKVAIECDGHKYHSGPENRARDTARDAWFVSHGWRVWRYAGWDIHHHLYECIEEAESNIQALQFGRQLRFAWASYVDGEMQSSEGVES
jgi:very-short-patch-repair endonuclease